MFNRLIVGMFALCSVFGAGVGVANGQESYLDSEQLIQQPLIIDVGSTKTLEMNMRRHVRFVELDAFGVGGEGMFEVLVNGQVKGTIHVPGQDPKYVVTIADDARTFTLRHLSGKKATINSFKVFFANSGSDLPPNHHDAANLSRDIINKMSEFQAHISVDDFKQHVLPIKVAAGHSYAIASASGDLSKRLAEALSVLQFQFHDAKPFFDSCLGREELFDLGVQALELMYQLDEMLD